jgi:hypothetical protein
MIEFLTTTYQLDTRDAGEDPQSAVERVVSIPIKRTIIFRGRLALQLPLLALSRLSEMVTPKITAGSD